MTTRYGYKSDKDFSDLELKEWIQEGLYAKASDCGIISNSLIVAGPDLERHVRDARKYVSKTAKSKIVIIDNNPDVFTSQLANLRDLRGVWRDRDNKARSLRLNVEVRFQDIKNMKAERFIDADLMKTVTTCSSALESLFSRQEKLSKSKLKAFIHTTSIRGCPKVKTFEFINNHLLSKIGDRVVDFGALGPNKYKDGRGSYCKAFENIHTTNNRLISILLLQYRECPERDGKINNGNPMMTCLIVYK